AREPDAPARHAVEPSLAPRAQAVRVLAQPTPVETQLTVTDKATGKPLPCRIHVRDAAGKAHKATGLPFWHDHFVCPGTATLTLPPGKSSCEIERGREWRRQAGTLTVAAGKPVKAAFELSRLVDLAADGWWCGELHVHRAVEDMELLMQAEDL